MDIGNIETVPVEGLRACPEDLLILGFSAIPCVLEGCEYTHIWRKEDSDVLSSIPIYTNLKVKVLGKKGMRNIVSIIGRASEDC